MDKAKRKELLKKYEEEKKQKFLNSLPRPVEKFILLFDYLDKTNQGCKGDLQLTIKFLKEHQCPIKDVIEWLYRNGGGCDCEVLANVEEQFVVRKIIPEPDYIDEDNEE